MKVYLNAYLNKNLGDDLFIKIITDRYPSVVFYTHSVYNYHNFANNLKIKNQNFYTKLDKITKKYNNGNNILTKFIHKIKYTNIDSIVFIGGSIFMQKSFENTDIYYKYYKLGKKPYYFIGANFGPYFNEAFISNHVNLLKNANDVCFRDTFSKSLFPNIPSIRTASDLVLGMDDFKNIETKKQILISVIDLNIRPDLIEYISDYETAISQLAKLYSTLGYNVILMSFCKKEGDEEAITRILSLIDSEKYSSISKYFYNGNIDESLDIIKSSEKIFATRFHAMILALKFTKELVPIVYSNKTLNYLNDINFNEKIIKISDIKNLEINSFKNYKSSYKIDSQNILDATNHFKILDKNILKET